MMAFLFCLFQDDNVPKHIGHQEPLNDKKYSNIVIIQYQSYFVAFTVTGFQLKCAYMGECNMKCKIGLYVNITKTLNKGTNFEIMMSRPSKQSSSDNITSIVGFPTAEVVH